MGTCAFVDALISCPACDETYDDVAWIVWGLCGPPDYSHGPNYQLGDFVYWRSDIGAGSRGGVAFKGSVEMANHGSPSELDTWLLDQRCWPETGPVMCPACSHEFFVLVQVRGGAIVAVVTVDSSNEYARQAFESRRVIENTVYESVTWRHGASDEDLAPVREFLHPYHLGPTSPHQNVAAIDAAESAVAAALLDGYRENLSRRLLCHGVAELVMSDPNLVDRHLEKLLRG